MEQNSKPRDESTPQGQLIFDKGSKNIQWRIDNLFKSGVGKTGQPLVKE